MDPYVYSPLEPSEYRITNLDRCEVSEILAMEPSVALATWNLFWMSTPAVDALPQSGANWWRVYKPVDQALFTMATDVLEDEVLFRKLLMHPRAFTAWFEREDHSIYDTFDLLGRAWADTVLMRANAAAMRMAIGETIRGRRQNVIKVSFGGRAA